MRLPNRVKTAKLSVRPRHDEVGPPPRRLGARVRLRARAAAEEDDGKDRQDARGQPRDDPADQADQH